MRSLRFLVGVAFACALSAFAAAGARAQTVPLQLDVDASRAPQKIYTVKEILPVQPGPFTFVYPEWIPGFHAPSGPVSDIVSLRVLANGRPLAWRHDLVDFYATHVEVPAGVASLELDYQLVGASQTTGEMDSPSSANLVSLQWSSLVMYPQGQTSDRVSVAAHLTLPAGWSFGTALPVASREANGAAFMPVSLYTLIDSPLLAGAYFKAIPLGGPHELDVAADSVGALEFSSEFLTGMKHLVNEAPAMYGDRHYRTYHFLLALSDAFGSDGIEHHESSDNRAPENYLTDHDAFVAGGDLLPHEYSHSWNGKYRRPADLTVSDYQKPEKTDLLWVYEGLNQYLGELLAARSRLYGFNDQLDQLALDAAHMDVQRGRDWRSLRDAADLAPLLYAAPPEYGFLRRSANDFYTEGNLVWLEADVKIRTLTGGAKSLDDFLHAWAAGGSTTPSVKTYVLDDVIATLDGVVHADWAGFFAERIATVQPRAPLGGITGAGWKLAYDDSASALYRADETNDKQIDLRFSLGLTVANGDKDGTVHDVVPGSPAERAGIAPGMTIVAVAGRRWSGDAVHAALKATKGSHAPLEMIVANGDFVKTVRVDYDGGDRYPHLVRVSGTPDLLSKIYAPRTFVPAGTSAGRTDEGGR